MAARARGGSIGRMVRPLKGLPENPCDPCGRKRERKALGESIMGEDVHDRMRIKLGLLESKPVLSKSGRGVVSGLQTITAVSACNMEWATLWDVEGGISVICKGVEN